MRGLGQESSTGENALGINQVPIMFRIIVRIVQVQFLLLIVFLICNSIAGPKNGPLYFAIVALTMLAVTVAGTVIRHRQR